MSAPARGPRVVAVSPHLDDAAFSAGALLAGLAAAGADVCVVTVFTASVPEPRGFALACQTDKGIAPEVDYMALRRAEDDAAVAALGAPVHLLAALLVSVPALLLPAAMGISAAFLVGWAVDPGGTPVPGLSLPLAAGSLSASLTAWWGPASGSLRRGSRQLVRAALPGPRATGVALAVLALVVVAAVIVVSASGGRPDWYPLTGSPLGQPAP